MGLLFLREAQRFYEFADVLKSGLDAAPNAARAVAELELALRVDARSGYGFFADRANRGRFIHYLESL